MGGGPRPENTQGGESGERARSRPVGGGHSPPVPLAHVVYALCGHGRGHASRATAIAGVLRAQGHHVRYAVGGSNAAALADDEEAEVYPVPALRQVMRGNRVRMLATARANLDLTWRSPEIIAAAADWLAETGADLVVADHEPFVARAARRVGVPVVALSHQLLLTETRPAVPWRHALTAAATALGIGVLAPSRPDGAVVPSFFFPPPRRGSRAVLVPPILRDDVLAADVREGTHVVVYLNEGDGMERLLRVLGAVDAPFRVYGLGTGHAAPPNVRLCAPSRAGFLADLATARAVVSTAGFTLLSEALHLGTPVLALPNRGFFEQTVNALALRDLGRGETVLGRALRAADVRTFLARADRYRRPPSSAAAGRAGREQAADAISAVLAGTRAASPVPTRRAAA